MKVQSIVASLFTGEVVICCGWLGNEKGAGAASVPLRFVLQCLLSDSHGRQHCFCQLAAFGCWLLWRDYLREPALVVVELGAVVLAEAEEAAGIRSNNRKQLLVTVHSLGAQRSENLIEIK